MLIGGEDLAKAFIRSIEPQRGHDAVTITNPTKRRRHFPTNPNIQYNAIDPNEVILPRKVIACLEGGMQNYIPLSILTSKACRDASRTAAMDKELKHTLKLEDGGLRMSPAAFDSSSEHTMSVTDWIDASTRYVKLLARYLIAGNDTYTGGPDAQCIAAEWAEHFRMIMLRRSPNV